MFLTSYDHTYNASNPATTDFPELFLPFKNLLRKIRELLLTLAPHEVLVLEMLLCQHEEPANISTKLKEVRLVLRGALSALSFSMECC